MPVTREFVESVRQRLVEEPYLHTGRLAEELNTPESQIVMALPVSMRIKAKVENFEEIWDSAIRFEHLEVNLGGRVSKQPDFVQEKRFLQDDVGSIWFVSMPLDDQERHSVRFFDKDGMHLLSIYLGQDHSGDTSLSDKTSYQEMWERFGVVPKPRMHCKGCGNCTCDDKKRMQ